MFDTMTLTKIVGGFCGALLVFMLGGWAAELLYHRGGGHGDDHSQAYVIDTGDDEGGEVEADTGPSFEELFVSADVGKGERVFNKCKACHQLEQGANGTGPYLYGVVGRQVDAAEGYSYSGALEAVAEVWTPQNLSAFLENPAGYAPGTTMGFAGLKSVEDRANVIAYLDQTDGDTYEIEMPASDEAPAEEEAAAEATSEEQAAEAATEEQATEEQATETAAADTSGTTEEAAAETGGEESQTASAEGTEETAAAEEQPASEETATEETAAAEAATEEQATEETASTETAAEQPAEEPAAQEGSAFAAMVAEADPAEGQKVFRKCQACHVADKEQNRVGPHLVGLVGRDIASVEGFRYSDALTGLEGAWTEDELNAWLENPKDYAPGNKMAFAGLRDEAERAAVIAYIESLAD
ncbi:MAG: cytochrome c family protein [Roseovarius sp.]